MKRVKVEVMRRACGLIPDNFVSASGINMMQVRKDAGVSQVLHHSNKFNSIEQRLCRISDRQQMRGNIY